MAAAAKQGATEAERSANVTRVENEILATKRQSMVIAATEYRAHIDALNAEANRHLLEVQRIEEAKRLLTMTTEEKIRELRRQGMTEFEATEDRKRQIVELQSKARDALAAGEFEQAKVLAQKAMDLAVQVGSAQTAEAKKAEEAKKASEQAHTQVVTLESQARVHCDRVRLDPTTAARAGNQCWRAGSLAKRCVRAFWGQPGIC